MATLPLENLLDLKNYETVRDSCKKWRLLPAPLPSTQSVYYCTNTTQPKHHRCAALDDWIVRCVGKSVAEKLTEIGVKTVEGLQHNKELIAKLDALGYYLDEENLMIRSYKS